jgi:multiple sugar transport system ATP-binding protein
MIYVTHDQVEAMTLASRIVVMDRGAIRQVGTPLDVYERPANRFVAGFLGAAGRFAAAGLALSPAPGCMAQPYAGPAVLDVRAEHVEIRAGVGLSGEVTLVEPMGNHQVVWLRCGQAVLASLVHDARRFVPRESVPFAPDAARVSLFDPQSGNRI